VRQRGQYTSVFRGQDHQQNCRTFTDQINSVTLQVIGNSVSALLA